MTATLAAGTSTVKRIDLEVNDSVRRGAQFRLGSTEAPPKVIPVLLSTEGAVRRRIVASCPAVARLTRALRARSLLTRTTRRSFSVPRIAKVRSDVLRL